MKTISKFVGGVHIILQLGKEAVPEVEIIERKGWGHPDKLADDLAETLSRTYAVHTKEICGAVLHHNFDKLCLLGGAAEVTYGRGRISSPIRVLVNGRASLRFSGRDLKVEDLIVRTCKDFFRLRLPKIDVDKDLHIQLNLSTSSSPGRVLSKESETVNPRYVWFEPSQLSDLPELRRLHANDTSIGSGYAPLSSAERFAVSLIDALSSPFETQRPAWIGGDIKIMLCGRKNIIRVVMCIPQIADLVFSRGEYCDNLEWLRSFIQSFAKKADNIEIEELSLNARDRLDTDEIYLTATGSAIESGDEGVVGRGNRVNGLITPMRSMNVEGANGKNPVYHVGKLYNVAARTLAERLNASFGGAVTVNLVSKTGALLLEPWHAVIQMEKADVREDEVMVTLKKCLSDLPSFTELILEGKVPLS